MSRAVELVERLAREREGRLVYTLGPLIHNQAEVERIRALGVTPVADLSGIEPGLLALATHGTAPALRREAERLGFEVIDAACPRVLAVHARAAEFRGRGFRIVIVGDSGHAEAEALKAAAGPDAVIVESESELDAVVAAGPCAVLAQTTASESLFSRCAERLQALSPGSEAVDTLCRAVGRRIEAAAALAAEVDLMYVIGGDRSSNTRRMFEAAVRVNPRSIRIRGPEDLDAGELEPHMRVGIACGASTPGWLLENVIEKLELIGVASK